MGRRRRDGSMEGVVRFRKRLWVKLEGENEERLDRKVGALLFNRRGTYCRDLGGWLVSNV